MLYLHSNKCNAYKFALERILKISSVTDRSRITWTSHQLTKNLSPTYNRHHCLLCGGRQESYQHCSFVLAYRGPLCPAQWMSPKSYAFCPRTQRTSQDGPLVQFNGCPLNPMSFYPICPKTQGTSQVYSLVQFNESRKIMCFILGYRGHYRTVPCLALRCPLNPFSICRKCILFFYLKSH